MELPMRELALQDLPLQDLPIQDLALQAAGVVAIVVAIAHGAIAELRVFAKARIEPPRTRKLLRLSRLDRRRRPADRRALARLAGRPSLDHCGVSCTGMQPSATPWPLEGGTLDGC
jgi:hypothetical protein